MNAIAFKRDPKSPCLHDSHAVLPDGATLSVRGARGGCIDLSRLEGRTYVSLSLSAAEAKELGAELLAAASAFEAAVKGGAA